MPKLFPFVPAVTTSKTFTSTQSFSIPAGVTSLTVVGKGVNGTPATSGHYAANKNKSAQIVSVTGVSGNGVGVTPGTYFWDWVNGTLNNQLGTVNGGGTGTMNTQTVTIYTNGSTDPFGATVAFNDAVPGSAYTYTTGSWKTTGAMVFNEYASGYVAWQEYGAYIPATAAKTGASANAFGCVFPGGAGTTATTLTFAGVTVVPLQAYTVTVPSGASITISYTIG